MPNPNLPPLPTRRRFLLRGSAATIAAAGAYAFGIEPRWVSVEHHELPIVGLPDHLIGKTAVQLSDLHVGSRVGDDYLLAQFEAVESLNPDFVFFTGDFLDNATDWHLEKAKRLLPKFPRGRLGNACVLGNHDFGNGSESVARNAANSEALIQLFDDQGLNLLIDQTVDLAGLQVAGLRDLWNGRFDRQAAADTILGVRDHPAIVLSHNPDSVDLPIWSDYQNWILCGHTHGGQCRFPIVGAPFAPVRNKRYISGKYEIDGGHKLYINRGLGHTSRVRFMARPEITMFTLKSA